MHYACGPSVRDEIGEEPTPEEKLPKEASDEKDDAKDMRNWWLCVATFVVVAIYAGLTFWQTIISYKLFVLSEKQSRPWIGLSSPITLTKIVAGEKQMIEYTATVKNFGQSPGFMVIPKIDFVMGSKGTVVEPMLKHGL